LGPLHTLLFELVRHLTGVLVNPWTEIEEGVWLESFTPIFIGAKRIRRGTRIYGGVTLGAGGPRHARGVPTIGADVVLAPGAIVTGPIEVPDGTVVGPNTVLSVSPRGSLAWLGVPAMLWRGRPEALVPAQPFHVVPGHAWQGRAPQAWPSHSTFLGLLPPRPVPPFRLPPAPGLSPHTPPLHH